ESTSEHLPASSGAMLRRGGAATQRKDDEMTSNLKTLGLAVVAMLAIGAMAASAAQGEITDPAEFRASQAGEEIKSERPAKHEFSTAAGSYTCNIAKFNGTQANLHQTTITLNAEYKECHLILLGGLITKDVTVTMNKCDFTLNATKTTKPAGTVIAYLADAGI